MMTFGLCLLALLVILLIVSVFVDCCSSFNSWMLHSLCGTMGSLCKLLGYVIQAIIEANQE